MGTRRKIGVAAIGAGASALGILAGINVRNDRYVDGIWQTLEQAGPSHKHFTEEMVSGLPDPARRYFLHAIRPGTPLASRLHWTYTGSMKPARNMPWMSLRAEQILARDRGFVWRATARKGPLFLTVVDHYLDGEGRMRVALFGLLPVVSATGPDLSRSARGRLLVEGIALPSTLLPGPFVRIDGIDESRFTAVVSLHGETTPLTLTVEQDGRPKAFEMQRWGNVTEDGSFRLIPYGGTTAEERAFGGYTIPTSLAVGWWYGTERYLEVVRLHVEQARLD